MSFYNVREAGALTTSAEKIRYALVITVEAPKHMDLYNDILRAYAKMLGPSSRRSRCLSVCSCKFGEGHFIATPYRLR